jgi:hypothetical protein
LLAEHALGVPQPDSCSVVLLPVALSLRMTLTLARSWPLGLKPLLVVALDCSKAQSLELRLRVQASAGDPARLALGTVGTVASTGSRPLASDQAQPEPLASGR